MPIASLIVKTPGTCGGRARVASRRIPVSSIYRRFLSGLAPEDILSLYEGLALAEDLSASFVAMRQRVTNGRADETEDRLERESRCADPVLLA